MVANLKMRMKEQKGFTLIELLAVIVILGIIAAIAIPAIGNVISKSSDKATAQEGLQIINAAKMYVANNPSITFTPGSGDAAGTSTAVLSKDNLSQYLDHVKNDTAFTVTVLKDSNNKYSYSLTGTHPAIQLAAGSTANSATEQQLVAAAQ